MKHQNDSVEDLLVKMDLFEKWFVRMRDTYKANFLWPADKDSIEEAGYEFANAMTEEYQKLWWDILIKRIEEQNESKNN